MLASAFTAAAEPNHRYMDKTLEREGVTLHVQMEAVGESAPEAPVMGQTVKLRLRATRQADKQPLSNWNPGAWMDIQTDPLSGAVPVCGQRIARFLSGNLMQRPLLDLNGYYVLSLDNEASVSVLDPAVNFSGRSSLYSVMKLQGKGVDWVKTSDDLRAFVAVQDKQSLAVLDLQGLRVLHHLALTGLPSRLALAKGERLLWVGLDGETGQSAAVVVDSITGQQVAQIDLPKGHHEFGFSADGRYVYATSRGAGTLTVIDALTFKTIREVNVGPRPLAVAFVDKDSSVWVAEAKQGVLHRYDSNGTALDTLNIDPGLGPMRVTPDGEHVLLVNPSQHRLYVLDTASGRVQHRLTVSGQPYDILFSEQYAYIRTLASEQVAMVSLASLRDKEPFIKYLPVGELPMAAASNLPLTSSMALTLESNGAFFASPGDKTLYHYMEGMNAPDTGLRAYGHTPMSAMVVRRGFREIKDGEYEAEFKLPSAGRMVLAIGSQAPVFSECLGFRVTTGAIKDPNEGIELSWLGGTVISASVGETSTIRVALNDKSLASKFSKDDLRLRVVSAAGGRSTFLPLNQTSDGEWTTSIQLQQSGGYYLHLDSGSQQKLKYHFATYFLAPEKTQ